MGNLIIMYKGFRSYEKKYGFLMCELKSFMSKNVKKSSSSNKTTDNLKSKTRSDSCKEHSLLYRLINYL